MSKLKRRRRKIEKKNQVKNREASGQIDEGIVVETVGLVVGVVPIVGLQRETVQIVRSPSACMVASPHTKRSK